MSSATPFLRYLNTNYVPSGKEMGQIQALVRDRQKLVDALDKEIDVLVKRREEHSRFVKEHSALLSPVRRIPNEILSLIFLASLPRNSPTRRRTILSKYHPAVVVSHVCQRWRQVSLNTALLWTIIDIDIPKFPGPHESGLEGGVDWWEGQLQAINEMARAWISRSANCSLTISFSGGLTIQPPGFLKEETVSRATERVACIADALCDVSNRWKAAHLSLKIMNRTSPPSQLLHLTFDDLIILESLSINVSITPLDLYPSPDLQSNLEVASGGELVKAPYLRRLAVGRSWVRSMALSVDWAALTELSFVIPSGQSDPTFPFPIFAVCPNLTRCSLDFPASRSVGGSLIPFFNGVQLQIPNGGIYLSSLHTFEIRGSEPPCILASHLHLPSLRQLALLCQPHYTRQGYDGGAIDLIRKFGDGLTDVTLDTRGFTESTLTDVLHLMPNVVSLRLVEGVQHHLSFSRTPIIFDSVLDELVRRDGEEGSTCPKLERFGCQMTIRSVFSQEALVRLIASRRSSSHIQHRNRPTTEASLKSAFVAFTMRKPARAVRDILEEMGVDLEGMTLITTYQGEVIDSASSIQVQMDDLYDNYDYASTVGQLRRTLDGWFL